MRISYHKNVKSLIKQIIIISNLLVFVEHNYKINIHVILHTPKVHMGAYIYMYGILTFLYHSALSIQPQSRYPMLL